MIILIFKSMFQGSVVLFDINILKKSMGWSKIGQVLKFRFIIKKLEKYIKLSESICLVLESSNKFILLMISYTYIFVC